MIHAMLRTRISGLACIYGENKVHGNIQQCGLDVLRLTSVSVRVTDFHEGVVLPLEVGVDVLALGEQIRPDEPSNIPSLSAVEVYHAPQSVCVKDEAPLNMSAMVVTLDTSHLEMSPLNDEAEVNISCMFVTLETSHLETSLLNNDAEANILAILVTLDTSHLEMSLLNSDAS